MRSSQTQLKAQNFKTFDKYFLIPEDSTIKKWIDTFQLQEPSFYCKFSNQIMLQLFVVVLAGKQLKTDFTNQPSIGKILARHQQTLQYSWDSLNIQIVKKLHKKLILDIKQFKTEYMNLEGEIGPILQQLQKISYTIVDERTCCSKKQNNNEEIQIIQFKLPSYSILGIFNKQKLKIGSQEKARKDLSSSNQKKQKEHHPVENTRSKVKGKTIQMRQIFMFFVWILSIAGLIYYVRR